MQESKVNKISTPFTICATCAGVYSFELPPTSPSRPNGAALVLIPWVNSLVFSRGARWTEKNQPLFGASRKPQPSMMRSFSTFSFCFNFYLEHRKNLNLTRDKDGKKSDWIHANPDDHPEIFQWNLDLPCTLAHCRIGITFHCPCRRKGWMFTPSFCIPSVISSPDCDIYSRFTFHLVPCE